MSKIGFIGTGVMGKSMAEHLLSGGHELHIFTRTKEKAETLLQKGAVWHPDPASLAADCETIFTIVGMPQDVEEVYFGDNGILNSLKPNSVVVDMTTSPPKLAEKIAAQAESRGGAALDAPVSGGDKGARAGTLSIMVGGKENVFQRVLPLFELMGGNIVYQGDVGNGQRCKICNQIVVAMNMLGVCESMGYAEKAGLEPNTVLQSITAGAAGSWLLSNLAPKMLSRDYTPGFYVKHLIKDLMIAIDSADQLGLSLEGTKLVRNLYEKLAEQGGEDLGSQGLYRLFE